MESNTVADDSNPSKVGLREKDGGWREDDLGKGRRFVKPQCVKVPEQSIRYVSFGRSFQFLEGDARPDRREY